MNTKKETPFSWPLLFAVTSASFFLFGLAIRFLDGSPSHITLFFRIGIISFGLAFLSFLATGFNETAED